MPVGDLAPEIALILTAVLVVLFAAFAPRRWQRLAATIALGGIAASAWLLLRQVGMAQLTFSGVWALDAASLWARLLILATAAVCALLAPRWFETDPRGAEWHAILLFSTLGAMAMAAAADVMQLVMAVLLSSVTGYVLAAYHRGWGISVEAGMKYFLLGALANALLVIGAVLLYGMTGATGYAEMAPGLAAPSPLLHAGLALVVVGLAFKLGAAPAHAWVPDVAEGAPVPSAAFLTVAPKIGAAIALARLAQMIPPEALAIRPLVAALAVASMTLGNLAALGQDDLRRLIGWSSVSQSGYALMAVAVLGLSPAALPALVIFLASYAAGNVAAFAVVAHLRGRTAMADLDGMARARPGAALVLVLAFLSLTGIPPVLGFVGKLLLFEATIDGGYAWLAAVAAANTVLSLFYYARVLGRAYFGEPAAPMAVLGPWSATALWIAAAAILLPAALAQLLLAEIEGATLLPFPT
jgi:NADH-quinone oxidoreductase subunit N